ncbi:hypothetical protein [Campylobacter blaseri]|uniref:Uncharacterized protein n=1 Tax=Campylobacter blaseri TaxID=2042961 RepID=A0A2P8QZ54_9BACT|nr:hypothetical protein [Campylobacter blaseri]PSM51534.1 hypothetical protein CQ405_06975 [Campylobacter blaseri]PSM53327.1 hypothetical protein CRN67_06980 [Campylobacter blaseri]
MAIKFKKDIIFIENKNKYLTNISFSGSSSDILKDFILSFVSSQKQLINHELNLRKYKKIIFQDGKVLEYRDENILKISVSTNNWFNIMNNIPKFTIESLLNIRFKIDQNKQYRNKSDFEKANKYLDELEVKVEELNKCFNINIFLTQTLFVPLELIVDKNQDRDFINILQKLVVIKMNLDNILDIYDYSKSLCKS